MADSTHWAGVRCVVTGGCGFIGAELTSALCAAGASVLVVDPKFVPGPHANQNLSGVADDLSDVDRVRGHVRGAQVVFHLGASTDMTWKPGAHLRDLERGLLSSLCLLEAMRLEGVRRLVYASSSAVYGDLATRGVDETAGPLLPCSTYGAAKLAAEGYIAAYSTLFDWQTYLLRFGNVIGSGMNRGALFDLTRKMSQRPPTVDVLGDGQQGRSYILVEDLSALMLELAHQAPASGTPTVLNVSGEGLVTTVDLVALTAAAVGMPTPEIRSKGDHRGWPGDVPQVRLNVERLRALGVSVKPSAAAASKAAEGLLDNLRREQQP